jgi:ribosomal protein L7/L12
MTISKDDIQAAETEMSVMNLNELIKEPEAELSDKASEDQTNTSRQVD